MKGLTGQEAAKRLDRRGGQVWVFLPGAGSTFVYACRERQDGAAVVVDQDDKRFVLSTDEARAELAGAMEAMRDKGNARLSPYAAQYVLLHRDILETDAGYAQVGCLLAVVSVVVGWVPGVLVAWLLTGGFVAVAVIGAPILGFLAGYFGIEPLVWVAVRVPALRDHIEGLAFGWFAIAPGVITVIALITLSVTLGSVNPPTNV